MMASPHLANKWMEDSDMKDLKIMLQAAAAAATKT